MVRNEIDWFFSRNKNGKYSSYAIQECWFLDDSKEGDNSEMNGDVNDSGKDSTNDNDDNKEDEDDENDDLGIVIYIVHEDEDTKNSNGA